MYNIQRAICTRLYTVCRMQFTFSLNYLIWIIIFQFQRYRYILHDIYDELFSSPSTMQFELHIAYCIHNIYIYITQCKQQATWIISIILSYIWIRFHSQFENCSRGARESGNWWITWIKQKQRQKCDSFIIVYCAMWCILSIKIGSTNENPKNSNSNIHKHRDNINRITDYRLWMQSFAFIACFRSDENVCLRV